VEEAKLPTGSLPILAGSQVNKQQWPGTGPKRPREFRAERIQGQVEFDYQIGSVVCIWGQVSSGRGRWGRGQVRWQRLEGGGVSGWWRLGTGPRQRMETFWGQVTDFGERFRKRSGPSLHQVRARKRIFWEENFGDRSNSNRRLEGWRRRQGRQRRRQGQVGSGGSLGSARWGRGQVRDFYGRVPKSPVRAVAKDA
jgi:hypothetical protein